ncbi:MAG TPA: diacylglycerol kinase family protein [Burkholderiaceae bacterium]
MPSPALALLNPLAGGGRCAALAAPLREALPDVPLFLPGNVALARERLLALPPHSRVVVAGGDGTVHQLLPALVERQHELALLPAGTGNDLARALKLDKLDWARRINLIKGSLAGAMDLGELRVSDGPPQLFMSSLTAGFDAAVAIRALQAPRWLQGMPRYLFATLAEIGKLRCYPLQLTLDGVAQPVGQVLFASTLNTVSYASGMPVAPGALIDDGLLNLVRVGAFGRVGALLAMPLLLAGWHLRHPRIEMRQLRELQIESNAELPLALDGETLPAAAPGQRLSVRALPLALRVVRA